MYLKVIENANHIQNDSLIFNGNRIHADTLVNGKFINAYGIFHCNTMVMKIGNFVVFFSFALLSLSLFVDVTLYLISLSISCAPCVSRLPSFCVSRALLLYLACSSSASLCVFCHHSSLSLFRQLLSALSVSSSFPWLLSSPSHSLASVI